METYKIVRFYYPTMDMENEVMETGLSLEEAQEHCNDDSTAEEGKFFDGYTKE